MVNVSTVLAVRTGKEISDAYAAGKACVILLTGRVTSSRGHLCGDPSRADRGGSLI